MKALIFAKILIKINPELFSDKSSLEYSPKTTNTDYKLEKKPAIGSLILNKYLHIGQMIFLALNNKKLFEDDVICFLNGGVVLEVCDKWQDIVKNPALNKAEKKNLIKKEKIETFAQFLINLLQDYTPAKLIEISHLDPGWESRERYISRDFKKNKINMDECIESYKEIFSEDIEEFRKINA